MPSGDTTLLRRIADALDTANLIAYHRLSLAVDGESPDDWEDIRDRLAP